MSRTALCVVTATGLVTVSLALMICRYQVLGDEVKIPNRPGTWKVTMLVNGKSSANDARLLTATPLDFGRQHIQSEMFRSAELISKPPDSKHPARRTVVWTQRAGTPSGSFQASYEFYCVVDMRQPTSSMSQLHKSLYQAPRPGECLELEPGAGSDNDRLSTVARQITEGLESPADLAEALFRFVDVNIRIEPSISGPPISASDCLKSGAGDSGAKGRLLLALLRRRAIPARLVTGLTLTKGQEQQAHHWVEAWVNDRWLPMCTFYHHFGRTPSTYLIFGFGDLAMARGRHVREVCHAFLVERMGGGEAVAEPGASWARRFFMAISFYTLPPAEQRLIEFLLLLPIAALIICIYRNVIGLNSFGTFAPALVGLAFRDVHSLPGIMVFISIVLVGWVMRRVLNYYHLLQVPRTAFLLTLVVILLIGAVVGANYLSPPLATTQYVALFPMVILTGMIERFWTLETEDSTASSFRTLVSTMLIAASIALILSLHAVVNHMFRYPETLCIIMAVQLLLGRYTGYKISEFIRFREFLHDETTGRHSSAIALYRADR
jgi:hypothetical protein